MAKKLTQWEVPRTHTEYNNLLILKLFGFEFVNCYSSLFYIAFFRNVSVSLVIFDTTIRQYLNDILKVTVNSLIARILFQSDVLLKNQNNVQFNN